jgi:hypothetical protein
VSFKALVIPEDPTYNGYILKPLVESLLEAAGHTAPRVKVLESPGARGFDAALRYASERLQDWPMMDLFLFLPDRDAKPGRADQLAQLEASARASGKWLLACAAVEEIEVWLLAGHPEKVAELGLRWSEVRAELKPSTGSFPRFLDAYGDQSVGRGRKRLMTEACRNLAGLLSRCEELQWLLERIRAWDGRPTPSSPPVT